jgi:hypothetical protein
LDGVGITCGETGYGARCIYGHAGYRVMAPRLGGNGRWREGMCEGHVGAARGDVRAKMGASVRATFPPQQQKARAHKVNTEHASPSPSWSKRLPGLKPMIDQGIRKEQARVGFSVFAVCCKKDGLAGSILFSLGCGSLSEMMSIFEEKRRENIRGLVSGHPSRILIFFSVKKNPDFSLYYFKIF